MGISPGPDTLRDFSFFHKFGDNNEIINRMKFDISIKPGYVIDYDNWSYASKLLIN